MGHKQTKKYLLGTEFLVKVDHKPLQDFNVKKVNNGRISKWSMMLQDYKFTLKYIKGIHNHIPDILSRMVN